MRRLRLTVRPEEAGWKPSRLAAERGELTRAEFAALVKSGAVSVNKRRLTGDGPKLNLRDELLIHLEERGRTARAPEPLPESALVFKDARIVVVDKPSGMPAQGTPGDAQAGLDTAVGLLLARLMGVGAAGSTVKVGLVHRLDLETSGLTVFARDDEATTHLAAQFRGHTVEKRYVAFVRGRPDWTTRTVDAPLGADPMRDGSQAVDPRGKPAITHFTVRESGTLGGLDWSLLDARPETGRTHQIRVHAAHVGLPLLGDTRYGGPAFHTTPVGLRVDFPRVALHAAELGFTHPDGGRKAFETALPPDLVSLSRVLAAR